LASRLPTRKPNYRRETYLTWWLVAPCTTMARSMGGPGRAAGGSAARRRGTLVYGISEPKSPTRLPYSGLRTGCAAALCGQLAHLGCSRKFAASSTTLAQGPHAIKPCSLQTYGHHSPAHRSLGLRWRISHGVAVRTGLFLPTCGADAGAPETRR
jgi:hypothetical protein